MWTHKVWIRPTILSFFRVPAPVLDVAKIEFSPIVGIFVLVLSLIRRGVAKIQFFPPVGISALILTHGASRYTTRCLVPRTRRGLHDWFPSRLANGCSAFPAERGFIREFRPQTMQYMDASGTVHAGGARTAHSIGMPPQVKQPPLAKPGSPPHSSQNRSVSVPRRPNARLLAGPGDHSTNDHNNGADEAEIDAAPKHNPDFLSSRI